MVKQKKFMERRFTKSHRTTIPTSFKIPEPYEFYNKATPFVQRTLLFVADESSGPKPSCSAPENLEAIQNVPDDPNTSKPSEAQEKSPKKTSFFFSPSKSCKIHGRSFFRLQTSPKKKAESDVASENKAGAPGSLISYAPGWSLKGEHLMKWQASGKTTIEVTTNIFYLAKVLIMVI